MCHNFTKYDDLEVSGDARLPNRKWISERIHFDPPGVGSEDRFRKGPIGPCEEDAFICCSECAVWQCYHHTAVDSQCGCIIFFDGFKLTEFQSLLCLRELAQNKAKRKRGLSKKNARAAKKPRVGSLNRIDTYFGRVSH